ncbi:MAG: sulfatase-like hydrolase/transferase [Acidobacteriales bacterium]|nr:sulfatase-like hydrolase/transferase [Terriglobales bacterium]
MDQMDRRKFVTLLSSVGAAACSPATSSASTSAPLAGLSPAPSGKLPKGRTPNVVLMICDDIGYGDLGCYGSKLPTPNLDKMASDGMRFRHFNAAHPICSASRASLLTGRYGLRMNTAGAFGPNSPAGTSLDETLVSQLFRDKGYHTKAIGKWHLGDKPDYLPTSRGFESFLGVPWSDDYEPLPLFRDKKIIEEHTDRDILTPRYTTEAVQYIEQSDRNTPFFLYLAFSYPHDPARASQRFRGKTGFGDYGDSVAEIDWSAGEVMRALERKGIASDTLVMFTSDHGPWYQGSPGLLRGRKASSFEGGFRVPFLAKWPGVIAPGRVTEAWCSNLDVLPTLAKVCDLPLPQKPLDGVDISQVFVENANTFPRKPLLYFSAMGNRGLDVHCIRRDEWKLRVAQGIKGEIYTNDRTTGARGSAWLIRPELYNLARDPAESYDIAQLHPGIVAELEKSLEEQIPSFPPEVVKAFTDLKQNKGDITTPPGASPRPYKAPNPSWSWEPEDRRWSSVKNE